MKIKCITHADFETPGAIHTWVQKNNYKLEICKPYQGEDCLAEDSFDFLIVMGGPQSPLKINQFPYLKDETALIQKSISQNKVVLGFCLGAQLIGEALGAKTEVSPSKEIGVFPITLTAEGIHDPLFQGIPKTFPAIHWHNDMPGETRHSAILASSPGCPRQIIRYAPRIYGLQCHLEITKQGMQDLIHACPNDLSPGLFTQTPMKLLSHDYDSIHQYLWVILDRLAL